MPPNRFRITGGTPFHRRRWSDLACFLLFLEHQRRLRGTLLTRAWRSEIPARPRERGAEGLVLGYVRPIRNLGVPREIKQETSALPTDFAIVCLSHLRWDFVYQRPQHIMARLSRSHRVVYVEEPETDAPGGPWLERSERERVTVVTPHVPPGTPFTDEERMQRQLLPALLEDEGVRNYVLWYYTPMAIGVGSALSPLAVVYDCMDELAAFRSSPWPLQERERIVLRQADLVFTGGQSLYEARRTRHPDVHCFPSGVDIRHFASALRGGQEPEDQVDIPHPRLGFYGVIDERMDLDLLAGVADARPGWHLVLVGPTAKINLARLPVRANIHYLGRKPYAELPRYLAGWEVALLPFAHNEATAHISPTKTPEYLAAGRPVVSTSIRDVVRPYGERGLVRIADGVDAFVEAIEASLQEDGRQRRLDAESHLQTLSWDATVADMEALIEDVLLEPDVPMTEAARV